MYCVRKKSSKGAGAPSWLASAFPFRSPPTGPKQGTFSSRPAPSPNPSISPSGGSMPAAMETLRRRQDTKKDPRPGPARATDGASPTGGGFRTLLSFLLLSRPFTSDDRVDRHGLLFLLSSPPPPLHTLVWGFSILGAQAFNLSCVHMPRQASSYHAWVLGRIPLAGLVRRRGGDGTVGR